MAYAAVITLKHTIKHLLISSDHILLVPPSPEILEFTYNEMQSLQVILGELDRSSKSSSRKKINALDGQIREAVCKFEDLLESHVSNQILSQVESSGNETHHPLLFSIDLRDLKQNAHSFAKTAKKMAEEYFNELWNPSQEEQEEEEEEEEEEADSVSSRSDSDGKKIKMVGLSDQFLVLKHRLTNTIGLGFHVIPLVGMAGIGKTTLAKEIYEDPDVLECFDYRAWVTVGRTCQLQKITIFLDWYLKDILKGKRYLIVLDDVWERQVWHELKSSLLDEDNGSFVLLTTRLKEVARAARGPLFGFLNMRLLNKEESWDLLHEKVFSEEFCPPQLEKAGKKIAEICDGLPLTIITVANLLSRAEKTLEYWNKVAEKQESVFKDAYDQMSKVLLPSYEYLPQYLKACFLYMGSFPRNYQISTSKLIKMWTVEGFLEPAVIFQTLKQRVVECLEELDSHSLLIVCQNGTIGTYSIKSCRLHSSFWHLCNKEAKKNKFLNVLYSCNFGLEEGTKNQRRLCIHNNVLFGIKDVYNLMEDDCASTVRSLLCFGPYHQYPVPIYFGLRYLKVLDALTIRFYEFPMEVVKLVQLKYLALTYNGELPASISKLWNLQFLIVHRHQSIKPYAAWSYLPIEIWSMKELKHLQIRGSNLLQDPNSSADLLPNLLTLLDVSAHSCTKEVFERIPNLEKLGIRIELAPHAAEPFCYFDHISCLKGLESFKCVVVNPEFRSEFVLPLAPLSMFPSHLRKLHLSGLGYPWECMSVISSLPYLQVLKLRCYAFRGPKWETHEEEFSNLKVLLIEDTDLVQWKVGRGSFPYLRCLNINHCYKLEELHWEAESVLEDIVLIDCNHSAVKQIRKTKFNEGYSVPGVLVHSSWVDGDLKP